MKIEQESCATEKKSAEQKQQKRIVLPSLKEYLAKETEEILSADNEWYAGIEVGHQPSQEEMAEHYISKSDGAKDFAKKFTYPAACNPEEKEELERENKKNEVQKK